MHHLWFSMTVGRGSHGLSSMQVDVALSRGVIQLPSTSHIFPDLLMLCRLSFCRCLSAKSPTFLSKWSIATVLAIPYCCYAPPSTKASFSALVMDHGTSPKSRRGGWRGWARPRIFVDQEDSSTSFASVIPFNEIATRALIRKLDVHLLPWLALFYL